jgi:hypothetical protein
MFDERAGEMPPSAPPSSSAGPITEVNYSHVQKIMCKYFIFEDLFIF